MLFERYTDRARRVVVLAQEAARQLHSPEIHPEHVLLGILVEGESVAAKSLAALGVTYDAVLARCTVHEGEVSGHMPFATTSKKCMEMALREALQLGHNYIGVEHLLLGIVRTGFGQLHTGLSPEAIKTQTLDLIGSPHSRTEPVAKSYRGIVSREQCVAQGGHCWTDRQTYSDGTGMHFGEKCKHCLARRHGRPRDDIEWTENP